jgi:hypothetical protein
MIEVAVIKSSQNSDSSASSITIPTFAMKSARERARHTARQFDPTDVPESNS